MPRLRSLLPLAALLALGSCDATPTGPQTGSITISLLTQAGVLAELRRLAPSPDGEVPALRVDDENPHVLLDEVRVRVTGAGTTRDVTSTTPAGGFFSLTVDNLAPGTYTVTVMGLVSGQVAHYGETAGVGVTAGGNTPASVTFPVFQPTVPNPTVIDTVDVLRFTVSYAAVPGATGYRIEWGLSPTFAGASSRDTTATSVEIPVTAEGRYYFRVRALNTALSVPGLPSPTKSVYVFQGVATVSVSPASPTVAAGATQQLTPEARDADNNIVNNVNWFWSSSNHAVATVSQTGLVTAVSGGSVVISAVGKGTPGSAAVTVTPRPPARLAFTSPPGNAAAGATLSAVRVAVQDATGATVTGDNTTQVTLAIGTDAGPGGTLGGLTTVSAVAGVATFSNLSIAQAGAGYTLVASATGLTGATSGNFNINPGAASALAFTVQPTAAMMGTAISPAIQVTVRDALGNRVTSASHAITMAIGTNPGSGALTGTAVVNAVSGVASFSGLAITQPGTGYTLSATATGLTAATSSAFDISTTPPATQLAFTVAPTSTTAGEPLSPAVQVEIRNAAGERVTTARDAVTLAFGANPGAGTLAGTKTVNAINGIASFTGIWVNKAATGYTLTATATGLTSATSSTFNIAAGAATRLRFVTQPVNAAGNVAQPASVTVAIVDAYDNTVTSATSTVTLGLASSPWRSLVSGGGGTLTATSLAVAAVSGVATFSNVRIDKPGPGYALSATTTGTVSAATSDAFNISVQFDGAISAGGAHSCAISTASGTYCWGVNSSGQLGGTTISSIDSIPVLVRGGLTFTSVVAGNAHSCGLTAAGTAYCWGNNGNGQLGINSTTNATQPALVSGGLVFQSLAAGGFHTCGLTTASGTAAIDRQVYCWGANWSGQIGVGTPASPYRFEVPTRVSEPLQTTRTVAITAGYEHTCAIATTSAAYCWGAGWAGQLGTNSVTATDAHVPTLVLGSHVWSSITAGNYHTCGISTTGGNIARCWGYNWAGQIGDNSSGTNRLVPTAVAGSVTTWSRLAAGGNFTCGTNASGTFCWGNNGSGEIGNDDPTTPVIIPTPVSGSLVFTSLTGGGSHACGRTATALYCWGSNSSGRLGSLGVGQVRRVPTLVIQ